jgi:hypothetical protein
LGNNGIQADQLAGQSREVAARAASAEATAHKKREAALQLEAAAQAAAAAAALHTQAAEAAEQARKVWYGSKEGIFITFCVSFCADCGTGSCEMMTRH